MKIIEEVLKKIKPSEEEERKLREIVNELEEKIKKWLPSEAELMLVGSVAKGTYLKNSLDVDFFILFPRDYEKKEMEEIVVEIGKKILDKHRIQYAEHPYIRGFYKHYQVDIVPCYKIKRIEEMKSAVDRTPFHTQFVKNSMNEKMKDETRLLKQFLKGIGCYGAEAKIEGFSGYLAELLIIKYGGFVEVVKNAAKWKGKIFLKLNGGRKKFPERFVFIDPVDANRNVAAAVADEKLNIFIQACRDFLKKPSIKFFFPDAPPKLSIKEIEKKLENFVGICFKKPSVIDDILYPQLKKAAKSLENLFIQYDFEPLRKVWHTNKEAFVLIELRSKKIEKEKVHMGPPLKAKKHVEKFKMKWGERIFEKDGRIWAKIEREYTNAEHLLKDKLNELSLGKNIDEVKKEIKICGKETACHIEFWSEFFCPLPPWKR